MIESAGQPFGLLYLIFSEGSIGGDITSISLQELEQFYTGGVRVGKYIYEDRQERMSDGSNGFALAPSRSQSGNALFYINPHTTFYFRGEFHVVSQEGLNAYGAATWGQLFLYQGFNADCGWMHTSSQADVIDFYKEKIERAGQGYVYWQDGKAIPVIEQEIKIVIKSNGQQDIRTFTGYRTNHGPVVANRDGAWVSVAMMDRPLEAVTQSFMRTKATGYESFRKAMDIRTNSSNNTVYADRQGNIAYWHGNFMPKRDPALNWSGLIDGTTSNTLWKDLHAQSDLVHLFNPPEGWIQNCNSNPFKATGKGGPDSLSYPFYMAPDPENFQLLLRNTQPLADRICCVNAAIWSKSGRLQSNPVPYRGGTASSKQFIPLEKEKVSGDIESITLDGLMSQFNLNRIDLLKIDIEGAEAEVFREPGLWLSRTAAIVIELHDDSMFGPAKAPFDRAVRAEFSLSQAGEKVFAMRTVASKKL